MSRTVQFIVGCATLVLITGSVVRLSIAHGDTDTLVSLLTVAIPVMVPSVWSVVSAGKTKQVTDEIKSIATDAKIGAEDAAVKAQEAAHNTNGKMDIRFAELRRAIDANTQTLQRHLEMHAAKGE